MMLARKSHSGSGRNWILIGGNRVGFMRHEIAAMMSVLLPKIARTAPSALT